MAWVPRAGVGVLGCVGGGEVREWRDSFHWTIRLSVSKIQIAWIMALWFGWKNGKLRRFVLTRLAIRPKTVKRMLKTLTVWCYLYLLSVLFCNWPLLKLQAPIRRGTKRKLIPDLLLDAVVLCCCLLKMRNEHVGWCENHEHTVFDVWKMDITFY